jgi:hypothetical protein
VVLDCNDLALLAILLPPLRKKMRPGGVIVFDACSLGGIFNSECIDNLAMQFARFMYVKDIRIISANADSYGLGMFRVNGELKFTIPDKKGNEIVSCYGQAVGRALKEGKMPCAADVRADTATIVYDTKKIEQICSRMEWPRRKWNTVCLLENLIIAPHTYYKPRGLFADLLQYTACAHFVNYNEFSDMDSKKCPKNASPYLKFLVKVTRNNKSVVAKWIEDIDMWAAAKPGMADYLDAVLGKFVVSPLVASIKGTFKSHAPLKT